MQVRDGIYTRYTKLYIYALLNSLVFDFDAVFLKSLNVPPPYHLSAWKRSRRSRFMIIDRQILDLI